MYMSILAYSQRSLSKSFALILFYLICTKFLQDGLKKKISILWAKLWSPQEQWTDLEQDVNPLHALLSWITPIA